LERQFDQAGRVRWQSSPEGGTSRFGYTAFGDLAAEDHDETGEGWVVSYDRLGRDVRTEMWSFDQTSSQIVLVGAIDKVWDVGVGATGQLTSVSGPDGDVAREFEYDSMGRPVVERYSSAAHLGEAHLYYDADSRIVAKGYPVHNGVGLVVGYERDADDPTTRRVRDLSTGELIWGVA
jgi:hypothetical protein